MKIEIEHDEAVAIFNVLKEHTKLLEIRESIANSCDEQIRFHDACEVTLHFVYDANGEVDVNNTEMLGHLVRDLSSQMASLVNKSGVDEQVAFILRLAGIGEGQRLIRSALKTGVG